MEQFLNFSLSRHSMRLIVGGGGASASCGSRPSVSCSGETCTSHDRGPGQEGGCACWTGDVMDIKPCPEE